MLRKLIAPCGWIAAGVLLTSGTAAAATGGTFVLGRGNSATSTAVLTNTRGVPLVLSGPLTAPPLGVGRNRTKVTNLNGDLLDNLDSTAFQRRLRNGCAAGSAMTSVGVDGTASCVALSRQWIAVVAADGSLDSGSPGTSSGHYLSTPGSFFVQLPEDVSACAWVVTAAGGRGTSAAVQPIADQPSYVSVQTASGAAAAYEPFHLLVTCP